MSLYFIIYNAIITRSRTRLVKLAMVSNRITKLPNDLDFRQGSECATIQTTCKIIFLKRCGTSVLSFADAFFIVIILFLVWKIFY